MGVHQLISDFFFGDAISDYTLRIQNILREAGFDSEIYALRTDQKRSHLCRAVSKAQFGPTDIVIFHVSIDSPLIDYYLSLAAKKILIYHNITPERYLVDINEKLAFLLKRGREKLPALSTVTSLGLADSEYSRRELVECGFQNTAIMPIIVDFSKYDIKPAQRILKEYKDDYVNILFVGRLFPNKRHDDILRVFYYYQNTVTRRSRLFLPGSFVGADRYLSYLKRLAVALKLENVHFCGAVPYDELVAYYQIADVFLSMSEHEGFCVPLLESMYFNVPIIALKTSAIPYTLDGAGVLTTKKDFAGLAELIGEIQSNASLRASILSSQTERLACFQEPILRRIFLEHIEKVM
jgi:L-malate glycosyltransferase